MDFEKISETTTEVLGLEIRGYDWKLIRKEGIGTYAVIAGKDEDSDDEEIVVEEYADAAHRKIWDSMSLEECAQSVYDEISE